MSSKLLVIPAALGLMGLVATAEAAPAGLAGAAAALKAEAAEGSNVEAVHWRRCWSNGFYVRCWRPAPRVYSFYYGPPRYHYRPYYRPYAFHYSWRRW